MNIEKRQCPKCFANMSYVAYGYPSEALIEMCKENGWILGGCSMREISYLCRSCKSFWSELHGFIASKD